MRRIPSRSVPLIKIQNRELLPRFSGSIEREFKTFLKNFIKRPKETSQALIFNFSLFNVGKQHQDYLKVIKATLEESLKPHKGKIFMTYQGDIVCFYDHKNCAPPVDLINKVRNFFSEDVMSPGKGQSQGFSQHYVLKTDHDVFQKDTQELLKKQKESMTPSAADKRIRTHARHVNPLTPTRYKEICDQIVKVDLKNAIHSQAICKLSPKNMAPTIVAREIYVHSADLQKRLCPGVDVLTDPWLFQSLTRYLDQVVLEDLKKFGFKYGETPLNLNLNIPSVLSDEFLQWDESRTPKQRKNTTIEFQKVDIFSDIGAYAYVRDFLNTKGYKVCLDGLTHLTLPLLDWKALKVDCIKVYWSPEMGLLSNWGEPFLEKDKKRLILAHCEHPQALTWGLKMGIQMFQGWHVDQLLMPGYGPEVPS